VCLDLTRDMTHSESKVHRDPQVEELVEELRDRVAFLERALGRRSVEAERYQHIVAALTQTNNQLARRLRELEAPQEPSGAPESAVVGQERAEPRSGTGASQEDYGRPRDTAEFPVGGILLRPWWRRLFGG
jgi:hypothetical protein